MTPIDVHTVFAQRRRRVARIRRQVTVVAVTVFLALWGVIFFQLVSGHDPALAKSTSATTTTAVAATSSTPTTTTASTPATTSSGSTSSGSTTSSSSGSTSSSSGSTSLTTHQS